MTDSASDFTGQIPENYDKGLGPVLFEHFGQHLAARAAALGPANVLELAAGTGIVTRMLRDRLPTSCMLTATDLNAPMLTIADAKFKAGEAVAFEPADAMNLPFQDRSFDLIVCQFGVMFFPDKVTSFGEARRVLRPNGHYLFNVWGPITANPFAQLVYEIGARFFPENPPGFYRVPFSYPDMERARADLAAAGFENVRHEALKIDQKVSDWRAFARGIVYGNPLIAEIEGRAKISAEDFMAAVVTSLQARFGPAPTYMPLEARVFTARAP
jgi:ubiquinone/menaquinone biosynthesis C-methylase UbiE